MNKKVISSILALAIVISGTALATSTAFAESELNVQNSTGSNTVLEEVAESPFWTSSELARSTYRKQITITEPGYYKYEVSSASQTTVGVTVLEDAKNAKMFPTPMEFMLIQGMGSNVRYYHLTKGVYYIEVRPFYNYEIRDDGNVTQTLTFLKKGFEKDQKVR